MAKNYSEDSYESSEEPYVARSTKKRYGGFGIVITVIVLGMLVFGGLYGYYYFTSPGGQRLVAGARGTFENVERFFTDLFVQKPKEVGMIWSARPNDNMEKYGVEFVKFQSVGAKKIPAGSTASFKYVVNVGENTPVIPLSLTCNVEPKDVVDGDVKKIPRETLQISSENPAIANNLRCNFVTKDVEEDKTVTVKGSMSAVIPTQRASLKVYLLSDKEYENLEGKDFFKVNNKPDKLPIKAVYNNEPVEIGVGVSEDYKQPVIVGKLYNPLVGISLINRWEGKVTKINSLLLFLPEGVSIDKEMSPKSVLCPFSEESSPPNSRIKMYSADDALLAKIDPFGSGQQNNYQGFECWLEVKEELVAGKKAGFETAYHVDMSYIYEFTEKSDVITVAKKQVAAAEGAKS